MSSNRRDFLQISASAAAALSLGLRPAALDAEPSVGPGEMGRSFGAGPIAPSMIRARPVPLGAVRITGGPLKQAQELDAKYLLALEPDRMMAYYRIRAGLTPKAKPYDGWDGGGRNLTGHIAGHHLSAVSLMYLATGDARFKARADYLVAEMQAVQEKNGDGYLSALENGREAFAALSRGEIRSAAFDLNGLWSPWYTLHKTFAGLRDAYRHTGNPTALEVETKFAGWAERVLAPLSDEQVQHMLNTEHGGMNEVLSDLYVDTGDRRWLELSYRFEHRAFTDALKRGQDNLDGKHVNCQIPKLIGSAARYTYTGDPADILAAAFFWDRVVQHHTYASGGQGQAEYFGPADDWGTRIDGRTCESCNVYNMLKLTRRLFSLRPDAFYADFQERAIFNHALASIDPVDGRMSYMVPVGRGVQQEYQDMFESFTCCVGTGMENHALYGDGLYFEDGETLWVNLLVPSTARFATGGVQLAMDTDFPDGGSATISLSMPQPAEFTLAVRRPSWAGDGFGVTVNGAAVAQPPLASLLPHGAGGRDVARDDRVPQPSSYVELKRRWKSGDVVQLTVPKSLRLEPTPYDSGIAAIMWGPLALAADLGSRREGREAAAESEAPVLVTDGRPVGEWLATDARQAGNFIARQVARVPERPAPATDLAFAPFYRTYERSYGLYQNLLSPEEFDRRAAALADDRERLRKLEAVTVSYLRPGDRRQEAASGYRSEPANRPVERDKGQSGRGGTGWFSYEMAVDPAAAMMLVVTFGPTLPATSEGYRILVGGTALQHPSAHHMVTGYYDVKYPIPASLSQDRKSVTVRLEAVGTGKIPPVFGLRMIRAAGS